MFQSKIWLDLLLGYLPRVQDETLVCYDQGTLAGALPMLACQGPLGLIANSLPYFGSNASFIVDPDHPYPDTIRQALWEAWTETKSKSDVAITVFVDTPFGDSQSFLERYPWDYKEKRIGHVTPLNGIGNGDLAKARLLERLHGKTRNMIKKAQAGGFEVFPTTSFGDFAFLQETHEQNIMAMGSLPKEWDFFQRARATFDTRTYIAALSGRPVAGLFLLRHHKVIEYFTPAIKTEFRTSQPLSAIIFQSMLDAAAEGFEWWNWGASWVSQKSLQLFKKRWGTLNLPYSYYIQCSIPVQEILRLGRSALFKAYPYFFIIPFSLFDTSCENRE